jgi:predicted small secreted protein
MESRTTTTDFSRRAAAIVFATLGLAAAGLTGCSTVEGAGEDLEYLGDSVSESSQEAQD